MKEFWPPKINIPTLPPKELISKSRYQELVEIRNQWETDYEKHITLAFEKLVMKASPNNLLEKENCFGWWKATDIGLALSPEFRWVSDVSLKLKSILSNKERDVFDLAKDISNSISYYIDSPIIVKEFQEPGYPGPWLWYGYKIK